MFVCRSFSLFYLIYRDQFSVKMDTLEESESLSLSPCEDEPLPVHEKVHQNEALLICPQHQSVDKKVHKILSIARIHLLLSVNFLILHFT